MALITIWHNPRCSKSRAALLRLQEAGITPQVRLYLKDPPTAAELEAALKALGDIAPLDMMRRGEAVFKELGLGPDTPADTLMAAMADHPILIERPIVFAEGEAVIARPTERLDPLLDRLR